MNPRLVLPCLVLPLAACVTVGYESVVLDPVFADSAKAIAVSRRSGFVNSETYDVSLGDFNARNVAFSEPEVLYSGRDAGEVEREVRVNNTAWNLIVNQAVQGEWVTYAQYRLDEESTLRFSLDHADGRRVDAQCVINSTGLENEETSRLELNLTHDRKSGESVEYGEWLATRVICTLRDSAQTWVLRLVQQAEQPPAVALMRGKTPLSVALLAEAQTQAPNTAGSVALFPDSVPVGGSLPGIRFDDNGRPLGAVSLSNNNNTIWLAPDLDPADEALMVASAYVLILRAWQFSGV